MDNKQFGETLEKRTELFSVAVIKMTNTFPQSDEARILKNQVIRSATSIGANYREANRAKSPSDFKYKIRLCEGEASETNYWLSIIGRMNWLENKSIQQNLNESREILAIFTKINQSMRSKELAKARR